MNVLLTSAGRRTYMADYFKEALRGEGLVYVANSSYSPACGRGDGYFLTPLIYSREYIPFLLGKCRELEIKLLVSLFDVDLPVLAAHKAEFEAVGTTVAVSGSGMLSCCNDKYEMTRRLKEAGIRVPETEVSLDVVLKQAADGRLPRPMLVKPRFGMGSLGIFRVCTPEELKAAYGMCRREVENSYLRYESAAAPEDAVLIQELCGGNEYGLDVVCDLKGEYVTTIVRRKLGMRSGETDEAVILGQSDPEYLVLVSLGQRLAEVLGPVGLTDVDVIMDPAELSPAVIDINARFGGGYPFSHMAGADVPRAYVLWAQGMDREAREACMGARPGVHGYKDIVPRIYTGNAG